VTIRHGAASAVPGNGDLRPAIRLALTREAGTGADAKAVATAAQRVYDALASELAVLIGDGGVRALTTRSLHLVQREFPWLAERQELDPADGPFAQAGLRLERQDAAVAMEAAAATMVTLRALLAALIGEPLTIGIFRAAWPSAFPNETRQETPER